VPTAEHGGKRYLRYDEVLLHVDQVLGVGGPHVVELGGQLRLHLLQELADGRALAHLDGLPVPRPVPVRIHHLQHLHGGARSDVNATVLLLPQAIPRS
jgi:hypothetical protein